MWNEQQRDIEMQDEEIYNREVQEDITIERGKKKREIKERCTT
jgi:hypothetical protein